MLQSARNFPTPYPSISGACGLEFRFPPSMGRYTWNWSSASYVKLTQPEETPTGQIERLADASGAAPQPLATLPPRPPDSNAACVTRFFVSPANPSMQSSYAHTTNQATSLRVRHPAAPQPTWARPLFRPHRQAACVTRFLVSPANPSMQSSYAHMTNQATSLRVRHPRRCRPTIRRSARSGLLPPCYPQKSTRNSSSTASR